MGSLAPAGPKGPSVRTDVLVIDDEEDLRVALREILEGEGYATAGASNGMEALELLQGSPEMPRLILLDLMMPQMDGWEFLLRIDEDPRLHEIPVALMSAHSSVLRATDPRRAEAHHLELLLPKPLNLLRLLSTVSDFCSADRIRTREEEHAAREAPTTRFRPISD